MSTRCAAVCAMRLAPHEGPKPRRLQEKATSLPWPDLPQRQMGLDVSLQARRRPLRVGDPLQFQVLRDGQPLPGPPVELRGDLRPLELWRTTDAQDMVNITLQLAARWVLRGLDLRPASQQPDQSESCYAT